MFDSKNQNFAYIVIIIFDLINLPQIRYNIRCKDP